MHRPVLYKEIIHSLQPRSGGHYIDGTLGAGGHARGILEACAPDGWLLGLDVDPQALALARENLAPYEHRLKLAQASYIFLLDEMAALGWEAVDGIVIDLGASSMQFDDPGRGFSFLREGPLDMRFSPDSAPSAAQLVNTLPERELADLIHDYGEERNARAIARSILRARPIHTTRELAVLIESLQPRRAGIHPATRTFQALRMAVNDELANLRAMLPAAIEGLRPGGRLAVISFHSLEDRIVKEEFHYHARDLINPPFEKIHEVERKAMIKEITRKPIRPTEAEIKDNPRARSAKLRVAEKL